MKFFLLALSLIFPPLVFADKIGELEYITAAVLTEKGHGTGVLKTRKVGNDDITYVWTVYHVIEHSKNINKETKEVTFDRINIVQNIAMEDSIVSRHQAIAEVVKYSEEEDILLLKIVQKNFTNKSVKFYLNDKKIPLRTNLWNVNYHVDEKTSCVFTRGMMSNQTFELFGKKYDHLTMPIKGGCSGSGVYNEDAELVGLLARGKDGIWCLSVPVNRIVVWARKNNVEWALNDCITMPKEEDVQKIPMEKIKEVRTK